MHCVFTKRSSSLTNQYEVRQIGHFYLSGSVKATGRDIKPRWIFAVGLLAAFLVFGYFCVFQIPFILS